MSVADVCSNNDCLSAISEAEAAAAGECSARTDFANLPDVARLGCTTNGDIIPVERALMPFNVYIFDMLIHLQRY